MWWALRTWGNKTELLPSKRQKCPKEWEVAHQYHSPNSVSIEQSWTPVSGKQRKLVWGWGWRLSRRSSREVHFELKVKNEMELSKWAKEKKNVTCVKTYWGVPQLTAAPIYFLIDGMRLTRSICARSLWRTSESIKTRPLARSYDSYSKW